MKQKLLLSMCLAASLLQAQTNVVQPKLRPETLDAYNQRMAWFVESGYGLFIHFGLFSQLGGEWNGKMTKKYSEWLQAQSKIDRNEYAETAKEFNPQDFDADAIVRMAKDAGMKYLVITSKHHEGFCMWDSAYTDYDVESTPFKGRDILDELNRACRKHGIQFGIYYSIIDWHHPSQKTPYEMGRKGWPGQTIMLPGKKQEYVTYMRNQVMELIHNYNPAILWFDGDWAKWWTLEDGVELYNTIREASPNIIVNNRVAKRREFELDFLTQEQKHFDVTPENYWEACYTLNDSWGYKKGDNNWKTAEDVYDKLRDVYEKGGNLLLNVGPDQSGKVQPEAIAVLTEAGKMLREHPLKKKTPVIRKVPGIIAPKPRAHSGKNRKHKRRDKKAIKE